jgi:hypothetical protein
MPETIRGYLYDYGIRAAGQKENEVPKMREFKSSAADFLL